MNKIQKLSWVLGGQHISNHKTNKKVIIFSFFSLSYVVLFEKPFRNAFWELALSLWQLFSSFFKLQFYSLGNKKFYRKFCLSLTFFKRNASMIDMILHVVLLKCIDYRYSIKVFIGSVAKPDGFSKVWNSNNEPMKLNAWNMHWKSKSCDKFNKTNHRINVIDKKFV